VTTVSEPEIAPALASLREITEGALVVLIGPPGSGKSTLAGRVWQPDQVLSLDKLRLAVSGDECDQSATPDAVSLLRTMTSMRLCRGLTTVADATNVEGRFRRPLLGIAAELGVPATALVVRAPLEVCLARNSTRPGRAPGERWGRRIPDDVIRRYHRQMVASLPGLRREGFDQVIVYDGALSWRLSC
jgi:predicted kinase